MLPFFKYVPVRILVLVCIYIAFNTPESHAQHYSLVIKKEAGE